ncbi:hypothetical protein L210DRAFT_592679 [Boletus edulis BED1]|uniref:Uncharacterized protein n=1 Tax=Boletus edulis BED1 TaxID=1328754 RepID=A0AAD4BJC7_BOLED|nr:hypothetical protein L210DRAFT_592679 [Boletus edulis BED1]
MPLRRVVAKASLGRKIPNQGAIVFLDRQLLRSRFCTQLLFAFPSFVDYKWCDDGVVQITYVSPSYLEVSAWQPHVTATISSPRNSLRFGLGKNRVSVGMWRPSATCSKYLTSPIHTWLVIMTPAPIRLHDFEPGRLSTSTLPREAKPMHIKSALYSRSSNEGQNSNDGGGLGENTIIFITLGSLYS